MNLQISEILIYSLCQKNAAFSSWGVFIDLNLINVINAESSIYADAYI